MGHKTRPACECLPTKIAQKWFLLGMNVSVALHVGQNLEPFGADIAGKGSGAGVGQFVTKQGGPVSKLSAADVACRFKSTIRPLSAHSRGGADSTFSVPSKVSLPGEGFVAEVALEQFLCAVGTHLVDRQVVFHFVLFVTPVTWKGPLVCVCPPVTYQIPFSNKRFAAEVTNIMVSIGECF